MKKAKLLMLSLMTVVATYCWSSHEVKPTSAPSSPVGSASQSSKQQLKFLKKVKGATDVGSAKCVECHQSEGDFFAGSKHERTYLHGKEGEGCESCHGPGSKHVESLDPADIVNKSDLSKIKPHEESGLCLGCHQANVRSVKTWQTSDHARAGLSCWECHSAELHFAPKAELRDRKTHLTDLFIRNKNEVCFSCHEEQRLDFSLQFHHPIERGKMLCLDCHNPHGEGEAKQQIARNKTEACLKCHSEKRGPFVWPHRAMDEGCTVCHKPHGSVNDKLLTQFDNGLCLQCHYETQFPNFGDVSPHRFRLDRHARCIDCHIKVHGSNVSEDLTR